MSNPSELVLRRDFAMPRAELWGWLTDTAKTALWYGPYQREGGRLFITMIHEEGQPTVEGTLLGHEDQRMLHLRAGTEESDFDYRVELEDIPDGSRVTLRQTLHGTPDDPWFEAGWNFYLDCLVHAIQGMPAPVFEDYARHLQQDSQG